ncbi:Crp/Fnr family transcriptional regulator [Methylobacterium mesophilicum]
MAVGEEETHPSQGRGALTGDGPGDSKASSGATSGAARPPRPPEGARSSGERAGREATRPSRVDWTLPVRRRLDRSGVCVAETEALVAAVSRVVNVEADTEILRADDAPSACRLLLDGWTCRYVPLRAARPQILALQLPGEFLDLQGLLRGRLDHGIATLTPCRIGLVPHDALKGLMERHPRICLMVMLETAVEAATARRWLLNAGHRHAYEGMAHVICELFTRAAAAGLAEAFRFPMPLTQTELGSALGLTSVHANRTVKRLHEAGLVSWRGRWMIIEDWSGLRRVAEFDPAYLSLEHARP